MVFSGAFNHRNGIIRSLVFATQAIKGAIPGLQSGGNIAGTWISGVFLFIIGGFNLIIVRGVYKTFKGLQNGTVTADKIDESINQNSMMGRAYKRLFKFIDEPWQIYPIGVLFGLGFDTATQVALFAIGTSLLRLMFRWHIILCCRFCSPRAWLRLTRLMAY